MARRPRFPLLALLSCLLPITAARSAQMETPAQTIAIAQAPNGEALCEDFEVTVGGNPVPVYSCRVSAMPFNQVWPGYQRPVDQTELAGFAYWDADGSAPVEVVCHRPIESVEVRPRSFAITPQVEGNRIRFDLAPPRGVVVEVNGPHGALHLFPSPLETDAPQAEGPGLIYFGPGVHRPGRVTLESNQTVYIAPGAVVYGGLHATGASNIKILGRGIIDLSPFERDQGGGNIRLTDCDNITIDGVVMRDPDVWCCSLFGCRNATISNVKLIGLWRYNADGIDVCNSQNVTIQNSFIRSFDDSIVVKGLKFRGDLPVKNIHARGCVIWNDWGRAFEIGAETCAPEISNVLFEDSDAIHTVHIALDIQHGDRAAVRNIVFSDIRVETDAHAPTPRLQQSPEDTYTEDPQDTFCPHLMVIHIQGTMWSADTQRGTARNVLFKDIQVLGPVMPTSFFRGADEQHTVEGVRIENLRFNDEQVPDAERARLEIGAHVGEVVFEG